MDPQQETVLADRRRGVARARLRGLAVAGAVLVAAGIYVTVDARRNGADAAACGDSAALAQSLDPLAGGEVAAFQVARTPQKLADLAFTTPDGQPATLADYAGKVTLLNLWASWCAPCRKEMPALDRLQTALGGDSFSVVPVSIDTGGPERPAHFLQEIGTRNLPLNQDTSTKIFEDLKTRSLALGLPVTLLIDRNGCHLGHMNGPAEWDSPEARALIEAAIRTELTAAPKS